MSSERVCSFERCGKPLHCKTLCKAHYNQKCRGKELTPLKWRAPKSQTPDVCSFAECGNSHAARGLCTGHYQQWVKGQNPRPLKVYQPGAKCSFDGCEKPLLAHGLCGGHNRQREDGRPLSRLQGDWPKECQFGGCGSPSKYLGLCLRHYQKCHNYNITSETYHRLFKSQNNRCAVCDTTDPGQIGWHLDHDHACCPKKGKSCGKCVRSILCHHCNTGLGLFKDNPKFLTAAIKYLESHGKVSGTTTADS